MASPITDVAHINASLLIEHGLKDPYVPPKQSEELVEALHREIKTYEYKTYPDEGHGTFEGRRTCWISTPVWSDFWAGTCCKSTNLGVLRLRRLRSAHGYDRAQRARRTLRGQVALSLHAEIGGAWRR